MNIKSLPKAAGAVLTLFFAGCSEDENKVAPSSIEVTPVQVSLAVGGKRQLTAAPEPVDATDATFTRSSDRTDIAPVSAGGLVSGKAKGTATIKVKSGDMETFSCIPIY
jgi:uncharacterized protein YjdB